MLRIEAKKDLILGRGLSSYFYLISIDRIGMVIISADRLPYLLRMMSEALMVLLPMLPLHVKTSA
jgi:hypothetical protein